MISVFITGATGMVVRGVTARLEQSFQLRHFAPDVAIDDPCGVRGDVLDLAALTQALKGCAAVLHLAVASGHAGTYEDDAFNDLRFDINVKGTYHVFEAARRVGIQRVVYVSSLMVTWGHAQEWQRGAAAERVPGDAAANPVGTYGLTKMLGENIARHYAARHGFEALSLRIGAPLDIESLTPRQAVRPQQVPFPDLAQAFEKALTVPLSRYEVASICGNSKACPWDLGAARRVLGYEPQFCLDEMDVVLTDPFT